MSIVNVELAKLKALEQLAVEDFDKAVSKIKADVKADLLAVKGHWLPWKITLQWPVKLTKWTA